MHDNFTLTSTHTHFSSDHKRVGSIFKFLTYSSLFWLSIFCSIVASRAARHVRQKCFVSFSRRLHFHFVNRFSRVREEESCKREDPRWIHSRPKQIAQFIIAYPPVPTPTIKRFPDCSACICTTTGRCCCPRGIEAILSHRNRVWALCKGKNQERCRRARGPIDRVRQRPVLWGGPLSSPGTCKCSPDKREQTITFFFRAK